jgi:hypothetical protein
MYTYKMVFGIDELKKILLLEAMWSYTCLKFQESYSPPSTLIRVKSNLSLLVSKDLQYLHSLHPPSPSDWRPHS